MELDDRSSGWVVDPDQSFTTCTAVQRWTFDGDVPRSVVAGTVELGLDDARLRHLGPSTDLDTGVPYPGSFRYSPRSGHALVRPDRSKHQDFGRPFVSERGAPSANLAGRVLRFDAESASTFKLNAGRASMFAAGIPTSLHVFHDNLGSFEWRDEISGEWHVVGRLSMEDALGHAADLPNYAQALVTRPDGVAFTIPKAVVFVPLPQLGNRIETVLLSSPDTDVLGAPVVDGASLAAPCIKDGCLAVLSAALPTPLPSTWRVVTTHIDVTGAPDAGVKPGYFAPATLDRAGVASWCGPAGSLIFDRQAGTARFEPWRTGFAPILAQRPYRDRQDVFHQLGLFENGYHFAQVGGAALYPVPGPHLAIGSRTFWASETAESIDGQDREVLTLPPGEARSLVLPLLGLGPDTLVALVRIEGSIRAFVSGEPLPSGSTARLFHHQRLNGLHDLRQNLELRSIFDLAAFVHDGVVHVHSRMENRCLALPVSS